MAVKWLAGYLFDAWGAARFAAEQIGEAFDRAMDVWDEE